MELIRSRYLYHLQLQVEFLSKGFTRRTFQTIPAPQKLTNLHPPKIAYVSQEPAFSPLLSSSSPTKLDLFAVSPSPFPLF